MAKHVRVPWEGGGKAPPGGALPGVREGCSDQKEPCTGATSWAVGPAATPAHYKSCGRLRSSPVTSSLHFSRTHPSQLHPIPPSSIDGTSLHISFHTVTSHEDVSLCCGRRHRRYGGGRRVRLRRCLLRHNP